MYTYTLSRPSKPSFLLCSSLITFGKAGFAIHVRFAFTGDDPPVAVRCTVSPLDNALGAVPPASGSGAVPPVSGSGAVPPVYGSGAVPPASRPSAVPPASRPSAVPPVSAPLAPKYFVKHGERRIPNLYLLFTIVKQSALGVTELFIIIVFINARTAVCVIVFCNILM